MQAGVAAGGQAAAGFVEDAVFVEHGIHVHYRHAAAPTDGARQVDITVAALEEQRLYLPLLAAEAGTQAAVVQNHAQVAVDVIQVVAVEAAAELRFAHPSADGCFGI